MLKLDRDLIQRADRPATRAIITAFAQMAHALEMTVVGESVEDGATLHLLEELGCDGIQGYAVSHPLPPDQVGAFLSGQLSPGRR